MSHTDLTIVLFLFSMKTSFFKWKPDLDGAAAAYTKAGKCDDLQIEKIKIVLNLF